MITLYSGPVSWFSRKVEIVLHEKRLPFQQIIVPFSQTRGYFDRPADVERINPKRQVPVLRDGNVELYDSTVIIEYFDEAYTDTPVFPKDPVLRARCRQWDLFADEVMIGPIRKLMHRTEPHDQASDRWQSYEQAAEAAMPEIERHFTMLDRALQSADYLVEEYSVADIACLMAVFWSSRLAGPEIARWPDLARWYRALLRRDAVARVLSEIVDQDQQLSAPVRGASLPPSH